MGATASHFLGGGGDRTRKEKIGGNGASHFAIVVGGGGGGGGDDGYLLRLILQMTRRGYDGQHASRYKYGHGIGVAHVIRSFLSLAFFKPPNAIFVPGIYFFGFSRYSNYIPVISSRGRAAVGSKCILYQSLFVPCNSFRLVRVGV